MVIFLRDRLSLLRGSSFPADVNWTGMPDRCMCNLP